MDRSAMYVFWAAISASVAAHGAVSSVVPSPTGIPIETRATTITVGWVATVNSAGAIYSAQGTFVAPDGKVLGTTSNVLSHSLTDAGSAAFVETIVVPETIAVKAHLLGHETIAYQRKFSDGRNEVLSSTDLHIATPGGSANVRFSNTTPGQSYTSFDVYRLPLAFDTNAPVASVMIGDRLAAKVKVGYTAGGILDASWQVAGPNATEYRVLASVNQFLDATGEVVLQSPALPTSAKGVYMVRLQVTTPSLRFHEPEIRYVVK
jgi:hypothetical protein